MNKFELKERMDKCLYSLYNVIADIIFLFRFKEKRLLKNNSRYENIYKSKRCFILGTGPSLSKLTPQQIDFLKKEVVFGVNSFYKAPIVKEIIPKYYFLVDNAYWERIPNTYTDVFEQYKDADTILVTLSAAEFRVKELGIKMPVIYQYCHNYPIKNVRFDFSKNTSITMNVVGNAITLAMYMGFHEIYLLVCDYNSFAFSHEVHCYDDKDEPRELKNRMAFLLKYYGITTEFHYLIQKTAQKNGRKIVNLTDGSLLDAYEFGHIDDIILKKNDQK